MQKALDLLTTYWPAISAGLLVLASILNAATKHYSEHKGAKKALLFISEILSLVASKGAAGHLGKLKAPLIPGRRPNG